MNNNKLTRIFCVGAMAAAGAAAMVSCSDTWDDHFGTAPVTEYAGTTMQAIEENAPDFADVIKAVGYDRELASENVYTVWAPASFNKDSVLAIAATDSAAVVDQFIKNHVARYAVSAVDGNDERVSLMNKKTATMVGNQTFGSSKMMKTNLSCSNGVIHIIDANINYFPNVFEQIKFLYDKDPQPISLYAFLEKWDADSLDEEHSVSHGIDEDGNKIWVSPVYIRNNTQLNNVDALLYAEDSDYIAIIPSAEAYKKRYNVARRLLNFNPRQVNRDSLQNHYANMYAMTDLYYNINANVNGRSQDGNELSYDSLKSTNYRSYEWPNHLYYSKEPLRGMHPDKRVNDILAKSGTPTVCSNGFAYSVDKYPMSVTEQFFNKLQVWASEQTIDYTDNDITNPIYSQYVVRPTQRFSGTLRDCIVDTIWTEGEDGPEIERIDTVRITGERNYSFCYVRSSHPSELFVTFRIPNTLSGTYEVYFVTCPIWAQTGFDGAYPDPEKGTNKPYRFRATMYERNNNSVYETGTGNRLIPPADSNHDGEFFITDYNNKIDTLYLGDYTFKHAYPSIKEVNGEGALLQIYNYVSDAKRYSLDMLISGIILRPKEITDEDVITEAK